MEKQMTLEDVLAAEAERKAAKPLPIGTKVQRYGYGSERGRGVVVAVGHLPGTVVVEHKAIFAGFGPGYPQLDRTLYHVVDLTVLEEVSQ